MSTPGPGPVQVCPVVDGRTRGDSSSPWRGRGGGRGDGGCPARRLLVADLGRDHAEVILDHRVARQLGGALLQQNQRARVEDPAERVGDLRVLRRQLRGGLGEGERLVLVAAVLGEAPRQVVRRRGEARAQGQGLVELPRGGVEAAELEIGPGQPRVEGDGLEVRGLGRLALAPRQVRLAQQELGGSLLPGDCRQPGLSACRAAAAAHRLSLTGSSPASSAMRSWVNPSPEIFTAGGRWWWCVVERLAPRPGVARGTRRRKAASRRRVGERR